MDEKTPKRYRVDFGYGRYYFEPRDDGDWVKWDDVVAWINSKAIHLSNGGRDLDAKIYTKHDVEALVAITRAAEKMHEKKSASSDSASPDSGKP